MPFERTFTPDEPEFLPKHHIAAGYQRWVDKYGIVCIKLLRLWRKTHVKRSDIERLALSKSRIELLG